MIDKYDVSYLQHLVSEYPKGATHVVDENGNKYYFIIKGCKAQIWAGKWVDIANFSAADLENCSLIADLEEVLEWRDSSEEANYILRHVLKQRDALSDLMYERIKWAYIHGKIGNQKPTSRLLQRAEEYANQLWES